ncbi:hypothetical protein [Amycolatopsis sp. NPDC000740]
MPSWFDPLFTGRDLAVEPYVIGACGDSADTPGGPAAGLDGPPLM